jgi:hypothetical protein
MMKYDMNSAIIITKTQEITGSQQIHQEENNRGKKMLGMGGSHSGYY